MKVIRYYKGLVLYHNALRTHFHFTLNNLSRAIVLLETWEIYSFVSKQKSRQRL